MAGTLTSQTASSVNPRVSTATSAGIILKGQQGEPPFEKIANENTSSSSNSESFLSSSNPHCLHYQCSRSNAVRVKRKVFRHWSEADHVSVEGLRDRYRPSR